jgi:acyl carrier protein
MPSSSDVQAFVAEFVGVAPGKVTSNTLINDDLHVDGDDGVELIRRFAEEFEVDLSEYENHYFGPEGFPIFPPIVIIGLMEFFAGLLGIPEKNPLTPLPVSKLEQAARSGKWGSI